MTSETLDYMTYDPDSSVDLHRALVMEVRRRLVDESYPRVVKCLRMLDDDQIWWRPNTESNSIGNLVLHLCGNVRQWICSGVGQQSDIRERQTEFDTQEGISRNALIGLLDEVIREADDIIGHVRVDDLLDMRPVQVYSESVLSMLVHVVEHFSYHTGQIAWITKMLLDTQLGFYEGQDLG